MPILLDTPFEYHLGHGKGIKTYTHVKSVGHGARTGARADYSFYIDVVYGTVNGDGDWVTGEAPEERLTYKDILFVLDTNQLDPIVAETIRAAGFTDEEVIAELEELDIDTSDDLGFSELMAFATTQLPPAAVVVTAPDDATLTLSPDAPSLGTFTYTVPASFVADHGAGDYTIAVTQGASIMQETAMRLYEWLISKSSDYAGTVVP